MDLKKKKIRIVLLTVCILVFSQGCLSAEEAAIGVTLREGSIILPDETQISIGDSFESLESFSPIYLESTPAGDSYFLTSSSSIIVDIDYENEEIATFHVYLYSIDDAWTEIERVDVDGIVEVSRGMKHEELMDILEELGFRYELDWKTTSATIKVGLRNFHVAAFRFLLGHIDGELESVHYWEELP